ncbi:prefoldin subunit 3-like [Stylophora pistillata]|uniref:Prefoldin subunit 3 n=1 Tax=Stylophora pistillata TaxID=50429 RepID=A0A2B4SZ22_STYPI|nr:prefoldin subunit 3-like [Stylophora pistillata]PFX33687.1 Prefoldin subunit 3 [Stylophora pistillata]
MASEEKKSEEEKLVKTSENNDTKKHRGIPEALFLEDVDDFMKKSGKETAETVLKDLDEQHQKYKFMELNLLARKKRLQSQVPDLNSSLEMVKLLTSKKDSSKPLQSRFLLSDQVYCTAEVPPTEKVMLWLGANVMLEYSIEEAGALLSKNLNTAEKNLKDIEDDLGFLRDQYTTTEVNMARVYNWEVKKRQAQKVQSDK